VDADTKYPVIHIMPDQKKYLEAHQYGGTIRLGAWPCRIKEETRLEEIYDLRIIVRERFSPVVPPGRGCGGTSKPFPTKTNK
jgi:CTP synthase (UTP-ammonia lyase)